MAGGGGCPGPAAAARVGTPPSPEAAGAPVSTADSGGPGRASPALRTPRSGRASAPDREDLAGGYGSEGKSGLPLFFIYLFKILVRRRRYLYVLVAAVFLEREISAATAAGISAVSGAYKILSLLC